MDNLFANKKMCDATVTFFESSVESYGVNRHDMEKFVFNTIECHKFALSRLKRFDVLIDPNAPWKDSKCIRYSEIDGKQITNYNFGLDTMLLFKSKLTPDVFLPTLYCTNHATNPINYKMVENNCECKKNIINTFITNIMSLLYIPDDRIDSTRQWEFLTRPSNVVLAHQLSHQLGYDILEIKLEDYILDYIVDEDNAHYFLYYFFDHHCRIGEMYERYEETRDLHTNAAVHMEARRLLHDLIKTNATISRLFEWFRLHYNPSTYESDDMEVETYAGCEEVTLKYFSNSMRGFAEYIHLLTTNNYKWLWMNDPVQREFSSAQETMSETYTDSPEIRSRSNSLETNKENESMHPNVVTSIYNLVVNSTVVSEKDKNTFIHIQSTKPETLRCTVAKNIDAIGSSDILIEVKIHETATIKFRVSKTGSEHVLACRYSLCPASLWNVKLQYNVDMFYSQDQLDSLSESNARVNAIENEEERNVAISKTPKTKIENTVMIEREPLSYAKHPFLPYEATSPINEVGVCKGVHTDPFGMNREEDYVNIRSDSKLCGKFLICTVDIKFDLIQK